eukprot:6389223-Heterocapsa_arctica.AAC.1
MFEVGLGWSSGRRASLKPLSETELYFNTLVLRNAMVIARTSGLQFRSVFFHVRLQFQKPGLEHEQFSLDNELSFRHRRFLGFSLSMAIAN